MNRALHSLNVPEKSQGFINYYKQLAFHTEEIHHSLQSIRALPSHTKTSSNFISKQHQHLSRLRKSYVRVLRIPSFCSSQGFFFFFWGRSCCVSQKALSPSEHICIQSEERNNTIHSNCLLFLTGVNAEPQGFIRSSFETFSISLNRLTLNLLPASAIHKQATPCNSIMVFASESISNMTAPENFSPCSFLNLSKRESCVYWHMK